MRNSSSTPTTRTMPMSRGLQTTRPVFFWMRTPTQKARILKAMPKKGEANSSDTGLPPLQQAQGEPDAQGGGAEGDHR